MLHKIKLTILSLLVVAGAALIIVPQPAFAVTAQCSDGSTADAGSADAATRICEERAAAAASNIPQNSKLKGDCKTQGGDLNKSNCGIIAYLLTAINALSAVVGIVVVIMIAVGGIQYSMARDNPQATAAAKGRIINALIALVAYLFMYAFLQYIVPGGAI